MKNIIKYICLSLIFIFSLNGCSNSKKDTLIVATNAEFAPFEYVENGEFKGIDIDIIKQYEKYANVKIEIKNMDFDAALLSVSTSKADIAMAAITKNEKREENMDFTNSYYDANQVVIVNKDSIYSSCETKEELLNLLSLNSAKIGCQRGTTGQYYIQGDKDWDFEGIANSQCKIYDNGSLAVYDLAKNNIDAVIIDEAPALLYCKKNDKIKTLDFVLTSEEYCIAVEKGNNELLNSLNAFINEIKNNGTHEQIINSYFSDNITSSNNFLVMFKDIIKGLGITFLITILAFILGIIIGFVVCLASGIQSKNVILVIIKKISQLYVSVFRGTPVTVQLLIIYYVVFSNINPLIAAIVAFGLNSGAYVSEIIRGGINSINKGQMEAGRSLGLSYSVVMKKIIFPQAIRNSLPSLGNEFIALIKETSVVSFITVIDLYAVFRLIATASFNYKLVYLIMGVLYFVIIFVISFILRKIEKGVLKNVNVK